MTWRKRCDAKCPRCRDRYGRRHDICGLIALKCPKCGLLWLPQPTGRGDAYDKMLIVLRKAEIRRAARERSQEKPDA